MIGELKKGRYVYYHCTGYKGKCPEPYVREETLVERFGELLQQLHLDEGSPRLGHRRPAPEPRG